MIRKSVKELPVINLDGPQGNAFAVMGFVTSILKQIGYDADAISEVMADMQSKDYLHLISVGYAYTQHYTIWETDEESYIEVLKDAES